MTALEECVRRLSEVPASQWLEQVRNWAVWKVLCSELYKMRLVRALTPAGKVKRREFCEETRLKMEAGGFVRRLISDEATYHISGKANNTMSVFGEPRAQTNHQRDSPKVVVFCAVSQREVHGPFFFSEATTARQ
jgi:hypothetical protein